MRDQKRFLEDQLNGIVAYSQHLDAELTGADEAFAAFLQRAKRAVEACLRRRANGLGPPDGDGPRAVVVHREAAIRHELARVLTARGFVMLGEGDNAAAGLALSVVERADVLVLDSGITGATTAQIVATAQQFASGTMLVLHIDDVGSVVGIPLTESMALYGSGVPPLEIGEDIARRQAARNQTVARYTGPVTMV